jgi:DNA-binding LacI/PurR family transcriptional regulator
LPTAVAAATDVLAGILHAASDHGVPTSTSSPSSASTIPFAAVTVPALTTVRMPVER